MNRVSGQKSINVHKSLFAAAALALLGGARESRAATGLLANVPEAAGYTLVYEFSIPTNSLGWGSVAVPYSVDRSSSIATGSFDRVAYYLELVKATGETQWVYASMTPFTAAANRLGVPRNYMLRYNAYDSAAPSNATIRSNVSGITNTNGCDTVNLEFWPSNYGGGNDYGVPGANASTFDFGDGGATNTPPGHGSMQIHNYGAGQTLFAYNNWGTTQSACALGIGNQPSGNPDWTFNSANISVFTVRTLQVLVRSLAVDPLPATNVTQTSGWINGRVTVGTSCDVWAFWGDSDQGTNAALWANSAFLGSYSNGVCDVTSPVTGLSGGATNWYSFLASNDVTVAWPSASAKFITLTTPEVDNGTGALTVAGQATLRGTLTGGGSYSDVYIYWGLTDGGQSTNYEHVVKLANVPLGAFSATVGAYGGFPYHYICWASNAAGSAWAPVSSTFSLPSAGGALEYANGLRASVFMGTADTQPPVDLTGAAYVESVTRVLTGTKANTVLSMTEAAGKNIVLQGMANSWAEFGGSPGDHLVVALSGRFYPPATGLYTFRWSQDDRGWLFLDSGNDGVFDSGDAVGYWLWSGTGTRILTAGQSYPFMFFSQDFSGADNLAFWYTPPGGTEMYVCPSAQNGQWRYPSRVIPAVSIRNDAVLSGSLTDHSATLQGDMDAKNMLADVYVYWGRTDGGSAAGGWETNAYVGRFSNWDGAVSLPVDGLAANTLYRYTFCVSNEWGVSWAAPSETLVPGDVTLEAADDSASEAGGTGSFRVTRPAAATNGALTVFYTLGGTAENGADYATLPGSVTIPAGATSAAFTVTPLADAVWSEGDETVTATLATGNYSAGSPNSATVTIQDAALSADDWSLRMPIRFAGYDRAETLTNFPALVTLGPGLSGFSYSQFLSGANGDLRFMDGSLTRELPYEIEKWDPSGLSRVWVKVPYLTNNATIWMLWHKSGQTSPAYTKNGSVWSEGFVIVAHHSEDGLGTAYDSTAYRNNGAQSGMILQDAPGAIAGGDLFDGADDYMTFGTAGRPTNTLSFSAWVKATLSHEIDAESNSSTTGTSGQKWLFEAEYGGDNYVGVGLSVGTNGVSCYEHGNAYMPPLAVYAGNVGTNWAHVAVTYSNRVPRIYVNGACVRTGQQSTKTLAYAPYRLCGNNYGYFAGSVDETRVSFATRSGSWVWAEYMNAASNDVLAAYGSVQTPERPEIANLPASGVSGSAATLNGYLVSAGAAATAVTVCWGAADGGTDAGAWANTGGFGVPAAAGTFSTNITGLSSGTTYFFRYAASNAYGIVWSPATETLLTGSVTLQASDAAAAEYPLDTGAFTVSRGSAYDAPLTVHYTLSGTAANGADMNFLSGEVTIPGGAETADIVVTPLFNRNYQTRAADTVTLTLAAGGYLGGSPDSGTVTIANWQPAPGAAMDVPRNFVGSSADPLTGSEALSKVGAGQLYTGGSAGNTFSGDIVVDTDGGTLRVGAIPGAASGAGVTLPNMTAANTITVRRGGTFQIEENANGSVGSAPNRFGTEGNRPSVALNGGTLTLNGANYNAMVPQTFSALSLGAGYSTVNAIRNSGAPELVFSGITQAKGSHVNFTSSSGTAMGTATTNAPHVRFTTPPPLKGGNGAAGSPTVNILPGARYGSDWVTHDAVAGIRALTAAEYRSVTGNDVNTAGATENVKIANATPTNFPTLAADKTVNALTINVANDAVWTPTNKLTLTSGQLISGVQNKLMFLNYPSTLTAGSGSSDASLDVSVFNSTTYLRARIDDNGAGKVAVTKNGGATLTLDGSVDNTYSGGTYVNEGTLTTGGTATRRYLGYGPVRVDAGILNLGQVGATANASGDDYLAVNGGQIQIATAAYLSSDTFNIGPGGVIYGAWGMGTGLNTLDRGLGAPGALPNITLAPDAIIAHAFTLAAPLNLSYNTVRNLGTNADLYYGVVNDQNNAAGSITIGKGTAFKGVSTDRNDRRWALGTINVTPGTDEIWLQGMIKPGGNPCQLYLGNWVLPGGPVFASAGPLAANVLGTLILDDYDAMYGDTSAGKPLTFVAKTGATINANRQYAMGTGTGVASIRVEDGGSLQLGVPSALNGSVTVEAGGRLNANNSGGMTGTGTITMNSGSILDVSSATGLTGPQADALAASLQPGQVIRLSAGNFGTPADPLDAHFGGKAPVYELFYGNNGPVNPFAQGSTVMTLNRDAASGKGGMLVNDYSGRTLPAAANGVLTIGANGGTIAATSNTTFQIDQRFALGANALTIGATNMFDRILLPKLGTVYLTAALGLNTALPGSSITVIPGATLMSTANTIPDEPDVTVNGAFLLNGWETVGSLGGSGWVNLQGNTLTAGRNNNASTFSGTLTNTTLAATLVKTGAGRMDITSPQPYYTGLFAVNGGTLAFSGEGATTNSSLSAYTLYDGGTLLLDNSGVNKRDRLTGFSPSVTFNGGTFRFVGKDGEAAGESLGAATFANGAATVDVVNGSGSGSSVELDFGGYLPAGGTVNFTASNGTLGAAGDNPRIFFDGLASGVMGFATVGGAPAYYSLATGVRAFALEEGTEFDGTADQTGVDTTYTALNNHLALTAARSVNSLWIDSPGAGNVVNLGSSGAFNLSLASGRLLLTGSDDFTLTRSGSSSGTLTRDANGSLFFGVGAGRTLTVGVPIANGWGPVEKDGPGTLVLGAQNTSTGALNVNEGAVRYAAGGGGDLAAIAVNIWNAGVLDFAGDTDTLGALSIYSGGVTNSLANGVLTVSSLAMGGGPAGSSSYVQTGTGSLKLGGNMTFSSVNDPDMATLAGKLDLNGGTRTFTVNNSFAPGAEVDLNLSATIVGAAGYGVTKNGTGVLRLSSSNSFDGPISIANDSGTVIAGHPQALGAPSAGRTVSVGNNDSLVLDGANGNITWPALYTNLYLNGAGDYMVGPIRGAVVNKSGTNSIPCAVFLNGGTYLASWAGKLTLAGAITGTQDLTVNGIGDTELGGAILTGAKVLNKNGVGTLTLSGTGSNTFSGTTTVNAGKLLLAKANGAAGVNAIGPGALVVANGASVQYAPSSTNPDMIGTNAITLYGSAQLDVNGASDVVGPLTISSAGALSDSTPVRNTAGGGNWAVNGLTLSVAHGFLTTLDTGTGTLTLSNNLVFNNASTGRARLSGNLSLGAASRNFTINQGIHPDYDMAIDAVISGAAGVGFIKDSTQYSWGFATGGLLRFEGANTFDGNVTLPDSNKGTLVVANNQALGVPSAARTVSIGSGGSLALDGGVSIADPSDRIGLTLKGTGDSRLALASGALFSMSGTNTVPCKITLAGTTQIASSKRLVLKGMVNGAGNALTVAGPGETAVSGANGVLTNASSVTLSANATLTLENTASANKADRLINAIPVTITGGGIRFSHDGGTANYAETLGAVTVTGGTNAISTSRANTGQTSTLTLGSLTRTAGTVNFVGEGLGEDSRNRIFINGMGDGMIGPWATINGTAPAMYSSARGVYAGSGSEVGVAALGGTGSSVIPDNESASAVINTLGSEGPITLAAAWTNRILEVRQEWASTSTVVRMVEGVTNRTLQASRLMVAAGKASLTVGEANNDGALMALNTGSTLSLENQNPSSTLTVKSAIANNGASASGLAKFGLGPVLLSGSNSYAGATMISEGALEFGSPFSQRLPGAISGAGTLLKSGTNQLHLTGANSSFSGPMYISAGIIRPDQNSAFGSTANGTFIASGATLDVGSDAAVGGTRINDSLNLGSEEFTVAGAGIDGGGVIVNNGSSNQMFAVQRVLLSDDATFGGKMRWDFRSGYLFMNDHTLTKTGANEIAVLVPIYPGTGHVVVNQNLLRIESSALMNGSAANTATVNRGSILELYNLSPYTPVWSLILNEGSFFRGSGTLTTTNINRWAGPVTLNGKAFMNGNANNINWAVDGAISGTGTLVKAGNSTATLWLTGTNNTYSGGTIVSNGTLYARYPGSLPGYNDGRLAFGGDGFLALHLSDGTFGFTPQQIHDLYDASLFLTNTAGLNIDTSAGNLNIGYDLAKPLALVKQGTNAITLAGSTNTYGGNTYLYGGTLRFDATTVTNSIGKLYAGYSATNGAAAIHEGGYLDCASSVNGAETLAVGSAGTGSYGYYRMNGGTLKTGWLSVPGNNGYNAVYEQFAGDAYVVGSGSWLIMGWVNVNNSAAAINLYGGRLYNPPSNELSMNHNASRYSFNMLSLLGPTAFLDASAGGHALRLSTTGTNLASIVNLNGGTLVANRVYAGSAHTPSVLNLNGGALRAASSRPDFLAGLTAATVYPGGVVFDTAGYDVTVGQPLLAPLGFGLASLPLRSSGAGYVGAPVVLVTGGSGTGATAIASVDLAEGSPTKGTVTGLTVTSPGSGYLPGDKLSVALVGGGFGVPAVTNDCLLGLNSAVGGLTKLGLGTLLLGATNTYGGATTISNGVLRLGVAQALPTGSVVNVAGGILDAGGFAISNDFITASAGAILNGTVVCSNIVKTGDGRLTLGASLAAESPIVVQSGTLKLQSAQAGLYEGTLNGLNNTAQSLAACSNVSVQLSTRLANTNSKPPWSDNATYLYSGYIWNRSTDSVTWTFGESIDDNTYLKIDGVTLINDGAYNNPAIGTCTLTPGAHAFEARFSNGGGGAGLVANTSWWKTNTFGFGIDFQGRNTTNIANFVAFADPGDGSLLSLTAVSGGKSNLIDAAASLVLGEGALLDLDGYFQTLMNLSGSGTASNGTLTVTGKIAPGGTNVVGTLTVAKNTSLGSGTVLVDVGPGGSSDTLAVQGSVDLSDMSLEIANPEALDRTRTYTIVSCAEGGTLNGTRFRSVSVPDSRWHVIYRSDGSAQLIYVSGTLLRLR